MKRVEWSKSWGRSGRITFACLLLLVLCSCAGPTTAVRTKDSVVIGGIQPVLQHEGECLPSCLVMVLNHYGLNLEKRKVANELMDRGRYVSWSRVEPYLKKHGFFSKKISATEIKPYIDQNIPVIAEGKNFGMGSITHVVVIVGYYARGLYVIDPIQGAMTKMVRVQFEDWNRGYRIFVVLKSSSS